MLTYMSILATMQRTLRGFTIVELVIVIAVIAILASVTMVTYNGAQARGEYARAQTDMKHISDALAIYREQNGAYPIPASNATTFQPAATQLTSTLTPGYLDSADLLTAKTGYAYLYRTDSSGTDYALMRIYGTTSANCATLPSIESGGNSLMKTTGTCSNKSWGYWSDGAASW